LAEINTGIFQDVPGEINFTILGNQVAKITADGFQSFVSQLFPDGDPSAPGIAFALEPNSGFYRQDDGVIGLAILGAPLVFFGADGVQIQQGLEVIGAQGTRSFNGFYPGPDEHWFFGVNDSTVILRLDDSAHLHAFLNFVNIGSGQVALDVANGLFFGNPASATLCIFHTYAEFYKPVNLPAAGRVGYIADSDASLIEGVLVANYGITAGGLFAGMTPHAGTAIAGFGGLYFVTGSQLQGLVDFNGAWELFHALRVSEGGNFVDMVPNDQPYSSITNAGVVEYRQTVFNDGSWHFSNHSLGRDFFAFNFQGDSAINGPVRSTVGFRALTPGQGDLAFEAQVFSGSVFLNSYNAVLAQYGPLNVVGSFLNLIIGGLGVALSIDGNRVITEGATGYEMGYKGVPYLGDASGTLVQSNNGKKFTTIGNITVPTGLSPDFTTTLVNLSGVARLITQGAGMTMYWAGQAGATGNRTLLNGGVATITFLAASTCIISGTGLS